MREINFRGLGVDSHWWFGESKPLGEYRHCNLATFFPNVYAGSIRPETVGEWTGLHDKNGKEIYEGDIVILSNVLADGDKKICKAIMDGWQSLFESVEDGFYCFMGNTAQNYREVIGNIYENPKKDRSK